MAGFDCQFVQQFPVAFQSHCPVCLLILREPYQVTCCGKSFCKVCIQAIKTRNQPCPTCKQDRFDSYPNKGLQQPLYGFRVFCSNKESGCAWEGELGQLDKHVNSNPVDKEKQLVGCMYTDIACVYCDKLHQRHEIEEHQASLCARRPSTCEMCEEYESTYKDVITNHAPVCKCRPVSCPNSCGTDNLQHQHLEEHVSSHCPLSYVECEFSDAGCDAKVQRKDLPSHLTGNLVTHMSLLATENRKLQQRLKNQSEEISKQVVQLKQQREEIAELQAFQHKNQECGLSAYVFTTGVPAPPANTRVFNISDPAPPVNAGIPYTGALAPKGFGGLLLPTSQSTPPSTSSQPKKTFLLGQSHTLSGGLQLHRQPKVSATPYQCPSTTSNTTSPFQTCHTTKADTRVFSIVDLAPPPANTRVFDTGVPAPPSNPLQPEDKKGFGGLLLPTSQSTPPSTLSQPLKLGQSHTRSGGGLVPLYGQPKVSATPYQCPSATVNTTLNSNLPYNQSRKQRPCIQSNRHNAPLAWPQ